MVSERAGIKGLYVQRSEGVAIVNIKNIFVGGKLLFIQVVIDGTLHPKDLRAMHTALMANPTCSNHTPVYHLTEYRVTQPAGCSDRPDLDSDAVAR